jgi:hypothetical protein
MLPMVPQGANSGKSRDKTPEGEEGGLSGGGGHCVQDGHIALRLCFVH